MKFEKHRVVSFFAVTFVASGILVSGLSTANEFDEKQIRPPNVLFISIDDLRPETGCYGASHVKTPNLDRFAKSSLVFERAYCQQSVCNPSRTSLLTGMRPDSIGVTGNHSHFREKSPNVITLPEHFKNNGYHSKAIGKIYHGVFPDGTSKTTWDTMGDPQSWSEPAIRFGPRYYYTETGVAHAQKAYAEMYQPKNPRPDDWTKKLVFGLASEAPEVSDNTLYDGKVAEAAIDSLTALTRSEKPFFLAVGFIKPHSPFVAPKKYFDLYRDVAIVDASSPFPVNSPKYAGHGSNELRRYVDQPATGNIPSDNQKRVRLAYFACVSYIDAQIGRVLRHLERLGADKNTIVCIFGDHGYHLGEQGLWGKTTNFELDTRVPLIIRAPGMKAAGKSTNSLVELVDLYPTLSELAGLKTPVHTEGISIASILNDPQKKLNDVALSQFPRPNGLMGYTMRTPTHRLTQWIHVSSGEVRSTELYDYSDGLIESQNVADQSPELVEKMNSRWKSAFAKSLGSERGQTKHPTSNTDKSLTDKKATEKSLSKQENASDPNVTSFESCKPGAITELQTDIGRWIHRDGRSIIDNKHARSGNQCLQLAGGKNTTIDLEFAEKIKTDGQLVFWAERWTSRSPFTFRVEKQSSADSQDRWTKIYDGDAEIKVGRSFLSKVVIPLGDPKINRLRFTVISPDNTGILIDDIQVAPPETQVIKSVAVVPVTLPALVGRQSSALLKLKIEATGTLKPISLTKILSTTQGTTDLEDVKSFQVYYGGVDENFPTGKLFGNGKKPNTSLTFDGQQPLSAGVNYFWIACTLKKTADIDHFVGATCQELKFSNGKTIKLTSKPTKQRMGVAVRQRGDDGVHTFRIPGLVTTNKSTLIGVYDVRRRSGGDLPGDIDVGMSRSTDGGQTWEPMKIIMNMGNDPQWKYDGVGDPCVLVDQKTGTIWVAATWSHGNRSWFGSGPGLEPEQTGQLMLVKSDDDGLTWSKPINITKQVKRPEWAFLLQGPGKGISLADGTIVFPAQYQDPPNSNDVKANRLPHSTFIYSRDHGKNWKIATGAFDDTTESQVVELADSEIMINCRYNRESKRVVMTTNNMGKSWKIHPSHRKSLTEPRACMASLINVNRELGIDNTKWLLFSNPNSPSGRRRMSIKASRDSGETWPQEHWLLLDEQISAGYSCMTMVDKNTVGILYEGSQAQLTFQRIPLKEIIEQLPKDNSSSLSFARVFGDNMVVQCEKPIRIWGTARENSIVVLRFGESTAKTVSNSNGKWTAELAKQKRNSKPQQLVAESNGEMTSINNILVGEVWLCAGQSNMEWPASKTDDFEATENSDDFQLRLMSFSGAARGGSGIYGPDLMARLDPEKFSKGQWTVADSKSVAPFSAVGYYFGRRLRKVLDCPVGIIDVSIGGTPIESWISHESIPSGSELASVFEGNWLDNPVLDDWCKERARFNLQKGLDGECDMPSDRFGPNHSFKPGFMYAASVEPMVPMQIKGVLWYQGESNAETRQRIELYNSAFPLLVNNWRKEFKNESMPIAFVQLPAMGRPNWPLFREYQRRSLDSLQNVGMAVTIDTGDENNVHPRNKKPIGERLAQWALVNSYGAKGPLMGPIYKSHHTAANRIEITFVSVGGGLKTTDGNAPEHFEIAGTDGRFFPADCEIKGKNKVVLTSRDVPRPLYARYAWSPFPKPRPTLINLAGLPASPFTTEEEF